MEGQTGESRTLLEAAFADMHLKVGEVLVVQPMNGFEAPSFTVNFIGAHGQMSFLTSLPVVGEQGMFITPGNRFSFRVVHGVYAYAFTARSLRAHSRPYPYAHFSMPENVKYRQIRQSIRLETRLPVEIQRADGTHSLAILRDISEHGARLELTGMLGEVGTLLHLTLPIILPETTKSLGMSASIRNTSDLERSRSAGRFHYGVEFSAMPEEDAALLRHFIEHLLVEQLA